MRDAAVVVDDRHRAAHCPTAYPRKQESTEQPLSETTSRATSPSAAECQVENCLRCHVDSTTVCVVCSPRHTLTVWSTCQRTDTRAVSSWAVVVAATVNAIVILILSTAIATVAAVAVGLA
ncbi:hypothetical protein NESM_000885500 [Novymonas esmeraldas]|uniref:Uncharacterized protein n=1 Tax=Novymonas esmeraldas TaxID=1808958 RepID=A0AAW0EXW4_9TRYP